MANLLDDLKAAVGQGVAWSRQQIALPSVQLAVAAAIVGIVVATDAAYFSGDAARTVLYGVGACVAALSGLFTLPLGFLRSKLLESSFEMVVRIGFFSVATTLTLLLPALWLLVSLSSDGDNRQSE